MLVLYSAYSHQLKKCSPEVTLSDMPGKPPVSGFSTEEEGDIFSLLYQRGWGDFFCPAAQRAYRKFPSASPLERGKLKGISEISHTFFPLSTSTPYVDANALHVGRDQMNILLVVGAGTLDVRALLFHFFHEYDP